jgi:hypothetical protein
MIETLFVVNTSNLKPKDAAPWSVLPLTNQDGRVLDPRKSQNIATSLKALNVTIEEVCEALLEGIFSFLHYIVAFIFCSFCIGLVVIH